MPRHRKVASAQVYYPTGAPFTGVRGSKQHRVFEFIVGRGQLGATFHDVMAALPDIDKRVVQSIMSTLRKFGCLDYPGAKPLKNASAAAPKSNETTAERTLRVFGDLEGLLVQFATEFGISAAEQESAFAAYNKIKPRLLHELPAIAGGRYENETRVAIRLALVNMIKAIL